MPNWCSNDITITGEEAQLAQLAELLKADTETVMERLIPTPPELLAEDAGVAWYQWRADNWGTKWDMSEVIASFEPDMIELNYETAWAPNLAFWETISARFPALDMTHYYREVGMGFTGVATYQEGHCNDKCVDI